jgi:hypothetical protein
MNDAPLSVAPRTALSGPPRQSVRVLRAAPIYFALVFAAGLALGPVRVLWLEPVLGQTLAVLCETPFLLVAMGIGAHLAPRWARMESGWPSYLALGLVALVLQIVADLAVGFGLRGMTLADQLGYFTTPAGWLYAFALGAFALAPLIVRLRRRP